MAETNKKIDPSKKQLTVKEYRALQEKEANRFKIKIPKVVKIILLIPFFILALFAILYIPYLAISGAMSSQSDTGKK
ncbi:MAG: hypothetical protein WC676_02485 [Candidatus Omnitrophota bacterium]